MQALLQLPAPTNSLHSLRHFHDRMETYIRGLESVGQYQETYGNLLVPVVLDKLPSDIRKNLARQRGDNNWQLDDLRRAINQEINIIEAGMCNSQPEFENYGSTASFFAGARPKTKQPAAVESPQNNSQHRTVIKCAFCEQPHKAYDCRKYPSADSRIELVKKNKLCYNCLGKHKVSTCRSRHRCQKCHRKHHTSICNAQTASQQATVPSPPEPEAAVFHSTAKLSHTAVLLKTAIASVCSNDHCTDAAILFDEGSQRSFITEDMARYLQLQRDGPESVCLSAFGRTRNKTQHIDTATVYLQTDDLQKIPIRVLIVPTIATPIENHNTAVVARLPYLRGLKLAHPLTKDSCLNISLLIGADFYWDIVENEVIRGDGPTAVKSKIGYLLSGPFTQTSSRPVDHILNVLTSSIPDDSVLERFWKLESMGILPSTSDRKSMAYLQEYQQTSIQYADGKYIARLPWKQDHLPLPTNYDITKKRTENTIRRLRREPEVLKKYGEIIADQERRGFIEKVSTSTNATQPVHYIPHHPVKKESSTTPIRIVYDCSCRQSRDQPSLNDCLESTPPELNELTSLLVRFRHFRYAVTTDIEKAFLHVGLHEKDRDVTRFFWLEDPNDPDSPLLTYRFKVVLFGATCSPFMLNATILKHLQTNENNRAAHVLQRDLYVDNVISSFINETELLGYFKEARKLMSSASMNLRSWTSNSATLRSLAATEGVQDKDDVTKVLGLRWDPCTDELTFARKNIPVVTDITKRTILKFSSQIYDPLGLLSPVTIRAKLLLQDLWKKKFDWDVPLPSDIQQTWTSLAADLNAVTDWKFTRLLLQEQTGNHKTGSDNDTHLHVFVDASTRSYGAAAYICNKTESRLVMAKNRVAPLKSLTLPQLELMAAVIGARLATHLQSSLTTTSTTFWSDSQIVLHWLTTTKTLKKFVANRVNEIKELTQSHTWRYCPTRDNPADLLTRGIAANKFFNNQLWESGPTWLCDSNHWPTWGIDYMLVNTIIGEQTTRASSKPVNDTSLHNVINIQRYGSYPKLLRITAYVFRFITNCKSQEPRRVTGPISASELHNAEKMWIRDCQSTTYADEIASLTFRASRLPLVKQLRLFLDDSGNLRCGGRIDNAPVDEVTKFPYLLPKKHILTRLIVKDAHETHLHAGLNATVVHIRQKYWVPAIRQCVQSVIRKCVTCRRINGKPYRAPDPPPLPQIRVEETTPFSVTGVDFTGALYIKQNTGSEVKAYICLFTCATTRAVHLEVVPNLSEESFLQAFRRFVSRKSLPRLMLSDNATTFLAAAAHLKRTCNSTYVRETLGNMGTEWQFIPKRAPWYGGWWERLIGLTKNTLKKILGRSYVTMETMQTIVTEIEAVMNDRPLTYASSSFDDPEPLTPAHLLYGRRLTSLPYSDVTVDTGVNLNDTGHTVLNSQARKTAHIIDQFWRRWRTEYLTALREQHRKTGYNSQTIKLGDVVQVYEDSPRVRWKLAVIVELIHGRDGLIRAAKIRTSNGLYTTRPIVKLYPLEVVDK